MAQAARADSLADDAILGLARCREEDAEDLAHKLFRQYGLTMDVEIDCWEFSINGERLSVPYLKPSKFLGYLLQHHPDLLFPDGMPGLHCESFWRAYYQSHPNHAVFKQFSSNDLATVIPVIVHGDEGSGSKKQPVAIVSWQSVFGKRSDRRKFMKRNGLNACSHCAPQPWSPCCQMPSASASTSAEPNMQLQIREEDEAIIEHMWPTTGQHSYLSRHLCFVLPSSLASKGPEVLQEMLSAVALDLKELFYNGISVNNTKYHVGFLGSKGDSKWHVQCGNFTRSFFHLGTVREHEICPYCLGGHKDHPFEDCSDKASWISTIGISNPWSIAGPMEVIPFDDTNSVAKYRRDPLHIFKIGLARDLVGSVILMLATWFCIWDWPGDNVGLWPRMKRAHSRFRLWARANQVSAHFKSFSKDFLHMGKVTNYPYTGSKGSDSMLLIRWLSFEIRLAIQNNAGQDRRRDLLDGALQVCDAAINLFRLLYCHGMWLGRDCMVSVRDLVLRITRGYSLLAHACVQERYTAYALKTTLHSMHHMAIDIDLQLQRHCCCYPNILMWDCSQDEDFIGRAARVVRATHARTTTRRSIERHLVKKKTMLSNPPRRKPR